MKTHDDIFLQAIGNVLEQHYGRYEADTESNVDAVNFAILWNTLLDALKHGTLDMQDIDVEYIRLVRDMEALRNEP